MTTAVVTGRSRKVSFRAVGLIMGSIVAVAALAILIQGRTEQSGAASTLAAEQRAAIQEHEWLIGQSLAVSEQGPSVAEQVEAAIAAHSQAFPLQPSVGFGVHETTAEEAVAQHDALIDAWLAAGG